MAVELCWRTCISSRSNGEELARSGGVEILGALLARCCAVLTPDAAPTVPAATIAAHALRALAGMAAFPHAQAELLARCEPYKATVCADVGAWAAVQCKRVCRPVPSTMSIVPAACQNSRPHLLCVWPRTNVTVLALAPVLCSCDQPEREVCASPIVSEYSPLEQC